AHGAGEPVVRLNAAIRGLVAHPPVVTRILQGAAGAAGSLPTVGLLCFARVSGGRRAIRIRSGPAPGC
ncbi:hypothetical protein C5C27_17040, partial [Rathayibacter sp. AY2B7]